MIFRTVSNWPAWRPHFGDLERLKRQMDLLSEGILGGAMRGPSAGVFPLMNVTEDKENYYIRAELPGINTDDLDISVTGDTISIAGERKISEEKDVKYHRREREAGKFNRILNLPTQINTAKVEARCTDGLLSIVLPKAESAKQKQIVVKAS